MTWLHGDGPMAARVRRHGWGGTPLGPLEAWGPELRSATALVLDGVLPMALIWGERRLLVHNDAFLAVLGDRPPALGQPFEEVLPESWNRIGPFVERAFAGEASLVRDGSTGCAEGTDAPCRTFAFSPVRDARGRVAGLLCVVGEAASKVPGGETPPFLHRLSDALRAVEDENLVLATALPLLADHLGGVHATYCEIGEDGEHILSAHTFPPGPGAPEPARRSELGRLILKRSLAGRSLVAADIETEPGMGPGERAALRAGGIRSFACVPLRRNERVAGLIFVHARQRRAWSERDLRLVEGTGERIRVVVARCRALAERRRFARLVESSEEFIGMCDEELVPYYVNASGLRLAGLPPIEPSRRRPIVDILLPEDAEFVRAALLPQVRRDGRGEAELRFRHGETGEMRWAICSVVLLPEAGSEPAGYGIVARDITDRKHTEMALADSEERLRRFGDASSDILWIRDAETLQLRYLTAAFETVYGLARETLLAGDSFRNWAALIVPEDRERAVALIEEARRGEQVSFEYRVRRPCDGSLRWVRNTDFPMRDGEGRVRLIGGISQDVTELRAAQDALADAERRQRALIEGIPQLVWRTAPDGRWTWASPQWTRYTGLSVEASRDFGWLAVLHPSDRALAREGWENAEAGRPLDMETRLLDAENGRYRWFSTRAEPVRGRRGEVVEWLGTSTDIDDLRQLQEAQHVLVAELQHRTRNLIGVIRSVADQTMIRAASPEEFRDAFMNRLSALSRVQGLLSQSGGERVTIGDVVRMELQALGPDESGRVEVNGEPVPLRKSMVQTLALALHELATNARKYGALSREDGRLRIRWASEGNEAGDRRLRLDWVESGIDMRASGENRSGGGGYGRELIEHALPYALKARTSYELGENGLHCTIDLPIELREDGR